MSLQPKTIIQQCEVNRSEKDRTGPVTSIIEVFQFPTISTFSCSCVLNCSLSAVRQEISSSVSEDL